VIGWFIGVFMWVDCGSTWCMFSMYPVGVIICELSVYNGVIMCKDCLYV